MCTSEKYFSVHPLFLCKMSVTVLLIYVTSWTPKLALGSRASSERFTMLSWEAEEADDSPILAGNFVYGGP